MKFKASLLLLLSLISINLFASVIGDNAKIRRAYPDIATDYASPVHTVVTNDSSDAVMMQTHALINIDNNTITLGYQDSSSFIGAGGSTFDGYVFTGFSYPVINAQLVSSDIGVALVSFDDNAIYLDLSGEFVEGYEIVISFEVDAPARDMLISIDNNTTTDVAASGGNVNFKKEVKNLGSEAVTFELFTHVVFPNGQVRVLDIPQTYQLATQQTKQSDNWVLEVKPWFPQGIYSVVYTAIDKTDGRFYFDTATFQKL